MAFFRTNFDKQTTRDLDAARADREKLAKRLADAQATVDERRITAQQLARDAADDSTLDSAEAALRAGQDRITTLTAALSERDATIATLEQQLAEIADQKLRAESAAKLETMAADLEASAKLFNTGIVALAKSAATAGTIFIDARGLEQFTALAKAQVPDAISLIAGLLRGRIVEIRDGSASPKLPNADAPVPVKQVAPPPTKTVFFVRASKWRDADNNERKIAAWFDVELPLATAEKALALGAAVEVTDAIRKAQHGKHQISHPESWRCVDIDNATDLTLTEQPPKPIFKHVHRPAYQMRIG